MENDAEIMMLRTKVLTLSQVKDNPEDIPGLLEQTKIELRNELRKKQAKRRQYEEINNKINNQKF